jgi:predicted RNA-binding Zn ribbon-like protein
MVRYPRRGLPLPLELVNTAFAQAGQPRDALSTPAALDAWLRLNDLPLPDARDATALARFRALRTALRALFGAVASQTDPPADTIELLNALSLAAPRVAQLAWRDGAARLSMDDLPGTDATTGALAEVARAAMLLLTGPDGARLRACQAPGCVLFFLAAGRRRDWCSPACGNRARVARHYRRHRASAADDAPGVRVGRSASAERAEPQPPSTTS